jgi:hypothetical protein
MRKIFLLSLLTVFLLSCASSSQSLTATTTSSDASRAILVTPISQLDELIVVGRLKYISTPGFCGIIHSGGVAEYDDLQIINGNYSKEKIYVVHGCPGMSRKEYASESGSLTSFREGDYHVLHLTSKNIYKIESIDWGSIKLPVDFSKACPNGCTSEALVQSQDGMMWFSLQVDLYSK